LGYRVVLGHPGFAIPGEGPAHRVRYLPHRLRDARSDSASRLVVWNMN
jgi:hypothetical protein